MFTLGICTWKYSNNIESGYALIPTSDDDNIQHYFLQIASRLKDLDVTINDDVANQLQGHLKERLHLVQKQQLRLIYKYMNEIEPLLKILLEASNDNSNQAIRKRIKLALSEIVNQLTQDLEDLKMKARFIDDLKRQNFEYYNVINELGEIDNEQALERILMKNKPYSLILCSNDSLNRQSASKLAQLRQQLSAEKVRLVYADFSYCSFQLPDMMVLPTKLPPSIPDHDVINILLLGETGVGKSTFINAFANYLTFDTLQQAEANQPVALIPVSFLLTTGDNFDEHIIRFGDSNKSNTEDFTHPGQSVTQQCKSHRFDLRRDIGKRLCIIDTPGFGDTRGLNQDDLNMEHILKYINRLTHLNAVCFLLKPNESRLNIFLRTCFTQLLDLFGMEIRQNIVFAFTNARSTSYTPGNTAPLLRAMLNSLSVENIPFRKENTFCFDSESFRYLVALQNGIQFDKEDKHEYEMSWKTSVSESNRLLNYVCTQLKPHSLHNQWQSTKHAQIEIVQMIRPMLEAMRNILRNRILIEAASSNSSIKLCPKPVHRPTAFCNSCKRYPFLLGNFWVLPDYPHEIQNKCLTCQCKTDEHVTVDYILSYETFTDSSSRHSNEINTMLNQLCLGSAQFAYFLMNIVRSTKEDLFLIGLMRMMEEEKFIYTAVQETHHFNYQLYKELEILKQNYERQMQKIQSKQEDLDLKTLYKRMQTIYEIPMVHEQMIVIKAKGEMPMQKKGDKASTNINST